MEELLTFWFSSDTEKWWFGCTPGIDELVTDRFGSLLKNPIDYSTDDPMTLLSYVILYDQIVRHIRRARSRSKSKSVKLNFSFYSGVARYFSRKIVCGGYLDGMEPKHRCFSLMPLRHTFKLDNLEWVLGLVKKWRKQDPSDKYYEKFYYATIRAMVNIKNEIACRVPITLNNPRFPVEILDRLCVYDVSAGYVKNHQLLHSLPKFKELVDSFKCLPRTKTPYVLSISGGVDSMVCSYILKMLGYNFCCMMIDYGNRYCCKEEVDLVYTWTQSLGVDFYVRHITEINRTKDRDREFYEDITKKIRFGMYKSLGGRIILGHNRDDAVENIFANIAKKQHFDNLLGMKPVTFNNDVWVFRPMLKVTKNTIFDFAHLSNIPYLYDSTPKWAERGKMRDHLVPFVNKFNPNIIPGLEVMSTYYAEMYQDMKQLVSCDNVLEFSDNPRSISIKRVYPHFKFSIIYWSIIMEQASKKYGLPYVGKKSLNNFVSALNSGRNCKKIIVKKGLFVKIFPNKLVIDF